MHQFPVHEGELGKVDATVGVCVILLQQPLELGVGGLPCEERETLPQLLLGDFVLALRDGVEDLPQHLEELLVHRHGRVRESAQLGIHRTKLHQIDRPIPIRVVSSRKHSQLFSRKLDAKVLQQLPDLLLSDPPFAVLVEGLVEVSDLLRNACVSSLRVEAQDERREAYSCRAVLPAQHARRGPKVHELVGPLAVTPRGEGHADHVHRLHVSVEEAEGVHAIERRQQV
mmetsp:Transcript_53202/g.126564  ORF Transcript_53202/g.126564 Transcript_53202/m.126564 type:complete len:228 (+) Transcript_53202:195-878(+)